MQWIKSQNYYPIVISAKFSELPVMRIAIAAIFKNECEYILEWIAYHKAVIGIHDFIIADNISNDGSTQLLEALEQTNIIKRIVFPRTSEDIGPQTLAYNHIINTYKNQYDYFLFIDADEFLVNNTGSSIESFITKAEQKQNFGGLALNWQIFGSCGNTYKKNGLVTETFYRASKKSQRVNCHTKSLVASNAVNEMYIHHAQLNDSFLFYDETLNPAVFLANPLDTEACPEKITAPFTKEVNNHLFYVAHFAVKSKQEHFLKKANKGSGASTASRHKGKVYFNIHDLNDETCFDLTQHTLTINNEIKNIVQALKENSLYFNYCSVCIDINHDRFAGWIKTDSDKTITLSILIDEKNILELPLNTERKDVFSKGLSAIEKCGFNYSWEEIGLYKESICIWIKGSNHIIFEASIL
jgi:glycosyltransferase involved in cell wall biosynthesis